MVPSCNDLYSCDCGLLYPKSRKNVTVFGEARFSRKTASLGEAMRLGRDAAGFRDGDFLDAALRFLQLAVAIKLQRHAALVGIDGMLQVGLARFELADDLFEFGESFLET